jgi:signal transduction histidine kinase
MVRYKLTEIFEKISKAVVGVFNIDYLQERIVALCQDIFDAEACSLFLFDESDQNLEMVAARGYSAKFLGASPLFKRRTKVIDIPTNDEEKLGITGWIASTGKSFMSNSPEELEAHPHWRGVYDIEQFGPDKIVGNFYGVPLKVAEEGIIGVLKVEGKREKGKFQPFTDDDAHILDIIAAHIAIAIADARRVEKIQRQSMQLQTITNALHKVIASLSEELPLQYLFDEIIITTAEILSAEACVLFLKDEGRDILIEQAGKGYVEQLIGKAEYRLLPKEALIEKPERIEDRVGLTAWIAITGQPFLARNNSELRAHPHWRGQYDAEHYPEGSHKQCNSFLGVPLLVADEVVGVLKVENKKIDDRYVSFTDQDRQVFETLARSIAIAVGKVQEQRVKREQSLTDAMYRVSQAVAGRFEIDSLLAEIVEVGKTIFQAEACVVFLIDQTDPNRLIEPRGEGYIKQLEKKAEYRLIPKDKLIERPKRIEDKVGLTAWIAITGQPFLARNNTELRSHPHWLGRYDEALYPEGSVKKCESFLGLPLRVGDEILGVLRVENKKVADKYVPFDEREQHIFQILANIAAIAIRNARDFQKLQEAQRLAAIGMSAAAMAHRMSTPLQRIMTATENLDENLHNSGQISTHNQRNIENISNAVEQMSDAINRVRMAARSPEPTLKFYNIEDIIRDISMGDNSLVQQLQERQIHLQIVGLEELRDRLIQCDKNLVEEAISNLVRNSLEAVSNGGHVEIHVSKTNGELKVEVRDDGPGVDESKVKSLFEPFNTTKRGGLGLGLFIVRRNIEAHGGTVSYIKKDKGGCFRIELPQYRGKDK